VPNGLSLCPLHHRLFDHGAITVREDLRVRVARALAGSSARDLFGDVDGQPMRLPVDQQFYPSRGHLRWHHVQGFPGADVMEGGTAEKRHTHLSWLTIEVVCTRYAT
jgi:putative restriction endonuclease